MSFILSEIPKTIGAHFNEECPLGPIAAELIDDAEVAAYLTSLENDACEELVNGASVLFGRKGAGKSSLLNSFCYPKRIKTHLALSLFEQKSITPVMNRPAFWQNIGLTITIRVSDEIGHIHRELKNEPIIGPEAAARIWRAKFWQIILFRTLSRRALIERLSSGLRKKLEEVADLIGALIDDDEETSFFDEWLKQSANPPPLGLLAEQLRREFKEQNIQVLLLIDSMEEYDLSFDDVLKKSIGGLLQLIATDKSGVIYKVAFPGEILDSVRMESNPEKYQLRIARVVWRPMELLNIVTTRMLICLYVHENDFAQRILSTKAPNSKAREAVLAFWDEMFGGVVVNEAHHEESAIYYILRHTQLLPRQLINMVSEIVKRSKTEIRSYRQITHEVFSDSLRNSCDALVGGVESGFKYSYPNANETFNTFLPYCPIRCTYGELQRVFRQTGLRTRGLEYTSDFQAFLRAMLHMGVLGVLTSETGHYLEAEFGYTDASMLRSSTDSSFVMHPAFSLLYKTAESRMEAGKAVLPRGTLTGLQ